MLILRRSAWRHGPAQRLATVVPTPPVAQSSTPRAEALGWTVTPVAEALGALIEGPRLSFVSDEAFKAIHEALLAHQVLFFRDQTDLTPAQHVAFAERFGPPQHHAAYPHVRGFPQLTILENDEARPSLIELWHTDMTFSPTPPLGSVLHGLIIPNDPPAGDTEFLSMAAAFEALEPAMQERLAGMTAEHSFEYGFKESLAEPGGRERLAQALRDNPPVTHPVVRTHPESGRLGLFVNRLFTTKILDLPEAESARLLDDLYDHMEQPAFRCRFKWSPGAVAFWDNRLTQHRPVNDYWPQHRKLQRITIDGDVPFFRK